MQGFVAGGIGESYAAVVTEGCSRYNGKSLRLQQVFAEFDGTVDNFAFRRFLAVETLDRCEQIERAFGCSARFRQNFGGALEHIVAALAEGCLHRVNIALVHLQGSKGGILCHVARMVRGLSLDFSDNLCNFGRGGIVTDSPAGHAVRLRESVDDDGAFRHAGEGCGGAELRVVGEVFVHFIRNAVDVAFDDHFGESFKFSLAVDGTCRVTGVVQEDGLGLIGNGSFQGFGLDFESVFNLGVHNHRLSAEPLHQFRVSHPVRSRNNHFVAFVDEGCERIEYGVLGTAGHNDLFRLVVQTVFFFQLFGNGLADFENAYGSGVAGLSFANGLARSILNRGWCRKIGFARSKAHDVLSVGNHLLGQGIDSDCERCGNIQCSSG